jgi:hypothetical protein
MPNGSYERPLAFNAITYLQDLTARRDRLAADHPRRAQPPALGSFVHHPVRFRSGSDFCARGCAMLALAADRGRARRRRPAAAGEELVYMKAGDTIITHTSLLHSGTPNLSLAKRYFFSVYYNISWLKHTDTYTGPNCAQLIGWARGNGDHRALRLLGEDDRLQQRANSGFQQPDEARWAAWRAEDREALEAATVAQHATVTAKL